jgi:hypothetical protein
MASSVAPETYAINFQCLVEIDNLCNTFRLVKKIVSSLNKIAFEQSSAEFRSSLKVKYKIMLFFWGGGC